MPFFIAIFLILQARAADPPLRALENGFITRKNDQPAVVYISEIDQKQADVIFKKFAADKTIPFRYPKGGCYSRATAMAQIAEKNSVIMGKIFIKGDLKVKTNLPLYPEVEWGYHVAPVAYVKNKRNGKEVVEIMVFDPSLFSKPVAVEEWTSSMKAEINGEHGKIEWVYYGSRFQYLENHIERYKSEWAEHDLEQVKHDFAEFPLYEDFGSLKANKQMPQTNSPGTK